MGFLRSKSKNRNTISEIEVDGEVFPVDDSNTEEMVLRSADLSNTLTVGSEDLLDDDEPTTSLTPEAEDTSDSKTASDGDFEHAYLNKCVEKLLLFFILLEKGLGNSLVSGINCKVEGE